ncbi:MAG: aminotransferase class I/II-fold pyridoxal phosphate-dependent enzyme [Thermoflexus sp.]|uniref:aminotransferase class I/II-fold pyridoxal phosphate-dependent enzyme n=1 Tax=Thermoflexus TaxID=1495649 RepID=UPI001C797456|nr:MULTISPECIES: aminotransferase class I/II-fold pyridoxal phosphate-dependent enzyme [Thermoflexus]MDT7885207.1 aminotransferase class I/II-fold pyridoxal phosphate-dependent enzyme [Thermoflexus sp.]QWK12017.1 MAG: aminotransferase class I/II-fold pyridoxal phosphate-dependent enzyme [Thermoflexus hugenholtzii]
MPPAPSERMQRLKPYPFAALERRIAELQAEGRDVIRLDIGSPDMAPPPFILEAMERSARDPRAHGYAGYRGIPALRQAVARFYARRFGVELDPDREVLILIGSKEGIFNLSLAYLGPGDIALVPSPGYPTYTDGALAAGADVFYMPLRRERGWFPDFSEIPAEVLARAKILWLNYPNNPTAACPTLEFLKEAVAFAHRHNLLLAYDNPYADVAFDGYRAPSVLSVPGAKEVAVEFYSLSKSHNMAGWRVGMLVGNAEVVGTLARLKSNIDSGHFRPIQEAAAVALTHDDEWMAERNAEYARRRDVMVDALNAAGLTAERPRATIYVWARLPEGWRSADYAARLLEATGVSVAPGAMFGEAGEGYIRISLVQPVPRLEEAARRIQAFQQALGG